jgi:rubrerythrin
MSKSEQNLRDAFAGESQANRKYLAFSKKADQEGYKQVAKLFRAAAEAETVHAHAHLRTLKGVGSTADNLKEAIAGETHETTARHCAALNTPMRSNRSMRIFTRRRWTIWTASKRLTTGFALCADTPVKAMLRMNARSARPKRKRFLKWINIDEFAKKQNSSGGRVV